VNPASGDDDVTVRELVTRRAGGLRLTDSRTNRLAETPARLMRVSVHLMCTDQQVDVNDLRALLVCDVLHRVAELSGAQVTTALVLPDPQSELITAVQSATRALGIHPPTGQPGSGDVADTLGGTAHVQVFADGTIRRDAPGAIWLDVARVRENRSGAAHVGESADPLAVRLALLGHRYREPCALDSQQLDEAARTLMWWRRRVAGWAQRPSEPIPRELHRRAVVVLTDDLDTPAALLMLRHVDQAADVADGAKFEMFAYLDRVLGLELTREVGLW